MKTLFAVGLILFSTTLLLAQKNQPSLAVPNLSGTWELDVAKSFVDPMFEVSKCTLVIEHNDPEVKLNRTCILRGQPISGTEILFTDRRKEENESLDRATSTGKYTVNTVRSKSYWQKRSLIREFIFGVSLNRGTQTLDKRKYLLSTDGKTLTVTTVFQPKSSVDPATNGSFGDMRFHGPIEQTLIFRKN